MSKIILEITIILVLILANGLFAMAELAIFSARKVRLQQLVKEGNLKAGIALGLAREPNRTLSTVQIGITLIGIFTGALGGATIAEELAAGIATFPILAPYSMAIAVGVVVAVITYFSLVLGELVPKRLALTNPERFAIALAGPMRILSRLAAPIVRFLSASTDWVVRITQVRTSQDPPITEEEINILIDQGRMAGVFEEVEQELVESVFYLADRRISTLMTPRSDIIWLDIHDSPGEIGDKLAVDSHSRYPVCDGRLDNILGVVYSKDLMSAFFADQPIDLGTSLREPLFVPEKNRAVDLLDSFRRSRQHIAFVINEFGGLDGLVTVTDVLEAIVGDIPTRYHPEDPEAVQREDGSWLIDGMYAVHEFKALFELDELPDEAIARYETLSGFMMDYLGRIPAAGDHFTWGKIRFEVLDMDGRRVDKVLVRDLGKL